LPRHGFDVPGPVATHGYDVRTAVSAEGALALLDGWAPDVALLDLLMPRADGFELARRLRAPGASRPVLVAVTGMSSDEHLERALAAGFSYFLVKPADPRELMRLLQTCADELGDQGRTVAARVEARAA
jgi:CheY-like chemotaxis protein